MESKKALDSFIQFSIIIGDKEKEENLLRDQINLIEVPRLFLYY
jgi:hypothetical protein